MNSILNKNLQAFSSRFSSLSKILTENFKQEFTESDGQYVFADKLWTLGLSKTGEITAMENGLRLCSAYNPVKEAQAAVNTPKILEKSSVAFYGIGVGYHVIETAYLINHPSSNQKTNKLVIIEPSPAHLFASFELIDWEEVFKVRNLIIAAGCPADSVIQLMEDSTKINIDESGVSDTFFFDIPAFTSHNKNYFESVHSIIERNKRKNEINAATLKKFGKLWARNCNLNRENLKTKRFISSLKNNFSDRPFIVIAAGPSLEKIIPFLNELQKKCVLVCVETALGALLRNKIDPDFIILTDPQFWAYRHIAGLSAPKSTLITEISAYPCVFRFNCKEILLCASQFPDGQKYEQEAGLSTELIGDLGSGGSVASCCWNFAKYCGATNIYLAGLDLGYPGGQTHIRGSSAEQTWHTKSGRLQNAEYFTAASLHNANVLKGTDYNGNTLITDSRMKMFAWWFESRIAGCPEIKTFTLCQNSLQIPGIQTADINDLLK